MRAASWLYCFAGVCFCLVSLPMHGQSSSASVSGIVADASGAVVAAAQVILHNSATNVERTTSTSPSGSYSIVNVQPGSYAIEVRKQGFKVARKTQVELSVSQSASFNFALEVGDVDQSVSVAAESSEVQSSSAELGAVIGLNRSGISR